MSLLCIWLYLTGVYSANLRKHYLLLDPDWKDDIIPEIMDGHNIADFVDQDILQRLDELEREEDERAAKAEAADVDEDMSDQVGYGPSCSECETFEVC